MAAIPPTSLPWHRCRLTLILICASAMPAWSDQGIVVATESSPGWTRGQAGSLVAGQGFITATPSPRALPTWSPAPSPRETTPSWLRLQNGAGPAPGWSPTSAPVITPPLWQGT